LLVALDALTCCHNNAATGNEKDGRVEAGGFGIYLSAAKNIIEASNCNTGLCFNIRYGSKSDSGKQSWILSVKSSGMTILF